MIVIDSSVNKNRNRRVLEDIETRLTGLQSKSFNTETNVATEKIFDVATAAPRVIPTNIMVVSAKHGAALRHLRPEGGLFDDVAQAQVPVRRTRSPICRPASTRPW